MGKSVEIIGLKESYRTIVLGLEIFQKTVEKGIAGDNIKIFFRNINKGKI